MSTVPYSIGELKNDVGRVGGGFGKLYVFPAPLSAIRSNPSPEGFSFSSNRDERRDEG